VGAQPDPRRVRARLPANQFSNVNILSAINKARYDATTVMLQRRLPRATLQAHYTFAHAMA
jgi:hypothetical protein